MPEQKGREGRGLADLIADLEARAEGARRYAAIDRDDNPERALKHEARAEAFDLAARSARAIAEPDDSMQVSKDQARLAERLERFGEMRDPIGEDGQP